MSDWTKKTAKLNTGYEIPLIGLGTWQSAPGDVEVAVETALRAGYRHIDTAFAYENEKEVGEGIRRSGVPREEIFLTSKLRPDYLSRVEEGFNKTLENLKVDYLDLFLIHWPVSVDPNSDYKAVTPDWTFIDAWREMQKLPATGKVRSVGVSNFQIHHLEKLLNHPDTKLVPAVNQVELHPYNPSPKLREYNASKGIHTTGYSNLGSTRVPGGGLHVDPTIKDISEKNGKTTAQVLLKWALQKGWSVIPKSVTPDRIKANFQQDAWKLSEEDLKAIDSITRRHKVCTDEWLPERVFNGDDE